MGVINRGIKNAFRNTIRTISIVFILAVSIGMALIMLLALKTVQTKIDNVKSSIGNFITVSPAGIRGFEGGGELLAESDVTTVSGLPHVIKTVETMSDRVTTDTDTNLQSAIEPGSFGNRQRGRQFGGETGENVPNQNFNNDSAEQRSFTMPIMITGTNDLSVTANLNVSKFDITSGKTFDNNSSDQVALIGSALATKNNLSVDSTFQAYGKDIKVLGIFDGGNQFANASLIMPIKTLQTLSDQTGQISSITVQADSIDSVSSLTNDLKTKLGTTADITSEQDTSGQALAPLENIKTISLYSLVGSLVAGAIIIFLTMVMIVRERRREIGVLKAIGSSNFSIMSQFTVESLVLTLVSSLLGIILGIVLSNPVLNVLVNNSSTSNPETLRTAEGGGRAIMRMGANIIPGAGNTLRDLHTTVGIDILLYGLAAAILIAIIGSAIPSFLIAKVRPAEVMRAE